MVACLQKDTKRTESDGDTAELHGDAEFVWHTKSREKRKHPGISALQVR